MAAGRKTGGRTAGTPNKVGREVRDIWARLGGPEGKLYAEQLHNLAVQPHGDVQARLKALQIISQYVWTKRVEHTGPAGGPIVFTWQS